MDLATSDLASKIALPSDEAIINFTVEFWSVRSPILFQLAPLVLAHFVLYFQRSINMIVYFVSIWSLILWCCPVYALFLKNSLAKDSLILDCELPWKKSVVESVALTYMGILESQLESLKRLNVPLVHMDGRFSCKFSDSKLGRIGNMCFGNEIFRKVRLTYFDAGEYVQVFEWYHQS